MSKGILYGWSYLDDNGLHNNVLATLNMRQSASVESVPTTSTTSSSRKRKNDDIMSYIADSLGNMGAAEERRVAIQRQEVVSTAASNAYGKHTERIHELTTLMSDQ